MKATLLNLCIAFGLIHVICGQAGSTTPAVSPEPPTSSTPSQLTPVTDFKLPAFLGRWFMTYSSQVPLNTFLKDAHCVVQDNVPSIVGIVQDRNPNNDFKVALSYRLNGPAGVDKQIIGTANLMPNDQGQLTVNMQDKEHTFIVLDVGPTDNSTSGSLPGIIGGIIAAGAGLDISIGVGGIAGGLRGPPMSCGGATDMSGGIQMLECPFANNTAWNTAGTKVGTLEMLAKPAPHHGHHRSGDAPRHDKPHVPKQGTAPAKHRPDRSPSDSTKQDFAKQSRRMQSSNQIGSMLNNQMYPWAIVSDTAGTMLFILARDTTEFTQKYEQIVLQKVQSLGFTSATNKPIKIDQSPECKYAPMLSIM